MFALWLYRNPLKAFFFPLGKWGFPNFCILPRLKDGTLAPNPIRDNNVHSKRAFVILLFCFSLNLVWNSWGVSPCLIPQEVFPKSHHVRECFTNQWAWKFLTNKSVPVCKVKGSVLPRIQFLFCLLLASDSNLKECLRITGWRYRKILQLNMLMYANDLPYFHLNSSTMEVKERKDMVWESVGRQQPI